jgi:hypothetical protein
MWVFWTIVACVIWTLTRLAVYSAVRHPRPYTPVQRRTLVMPRSRQTIHNEVELTDISGEIRAETERAFRFYDGSRTEWVPKSQCEWDPESKTMTMPQWLALEKGFL